MTDTQRIRLRLADDLEQKANSMDSELSNYGECFTKIQWRYIYCMIADMRLLAVNLRGETNDIRTIR